MAQEDKELLLKDLCARLPYGPKVHIENSEVDGTLIDTELRYGLLSITTHEISVFTITIEYCKPYLRPMSSMTEEEEEEFKQLDMECDKMPTFDYVPIEHYRIFDWLNAHHFDYRGLIEKCLAIEVTKDKNPYENNN